MYSLLKQKGKKSKKDSEDGPVVEIDLSVPLHVPGLWHFLIAVLFEILQKIKEAVLNTVLPSENNLCRYMFICDHKENVRSEISAF